MLVNRREVLKTAAASAVAGVTLTELPTARAGEITRHWVSRKENGLDPIHMYVHDISNDYERQDILGRALQLLHTRFRSERVAANSMDAKALGLTGYPAEFVDEDAWKESNLEARGMKRFYLLHFQLEVLRLPDSAKEEGDEGPPFPEIHIHPVHEESTMWGKAPVGTVKIRWVKQDHSRRSGHFKVFVNTWHLGAKGNGSSAEMWASVIAHEMLHNLGHKHGEGEYVDGRQMNAFHRAVYCDGKYDKNREVPGFT
jgi:hypothetical protein